MIGGLAAILLTITPALAGSSNASQDFLNNGYSQFYHFCDQEKDLSLLTYIKSTPAAVADYQKRISSTARDDMAILSKFAADNKALRLNKPSLSSFETNVRTSMDFDRNKQLLIGTTGALYAQAMLMTQSEATNYGLHVAKVLAESEPNPARARAMARICERWTSLHAEAARLNR